MKKKILIPVLILLILAVAGGSVYYFVLRDKDTPVEPLSYTYEVKDSFITNVKDSNKLFKTTIILESNDGELADLLSQKEYIVRDTILFLLRGLTEEDLSGDAIQDSMRTEIADALNKALGIDSITTVYFTDFVMQ